MAIRYWVGGTGSQSFASTANWSASRNGASGASVPTSTDTAYIWDGTSDIDTGLSQAALTGVLDVSFGGTIGTNGGTALVTDCLTVRYYGTGKFANFGTSTGVSNLSVYSSEGMVTFNAGLAGEVFVGPNALVTFNGTGTFTTLYNAGGIVQCNGAAVDTVLNYQGTVSFTCNVDELSVFSGYANTQNTAAVTTFAKVYSGATLQHSSTGTITFLYAYPDSTANDAGAPGSFTVTASELWPNASLFQNPSVSITYTNPTGHRAMP